MVEKNMEKILVIGAIASAASTIVSYWMSGSL